MAGAGGAAALTRRACRRPTSRGFATRIQPFQCLSPVPCFLPFPIAQYQALGWPLGLEFSTHSSSWSAKDRRVSIEDSETRHGRRSKSRRFNGYKRHIAADLDSELILAAAITPANRPEEDAAPVLKKDIEAQNLRIGELFIDRGYINSSIVDEVIGIGGDVVCKPWVPRNGSGVFTRSAFKINVRDMTITCPAGEVERFVPGAVVEFDPEACDQCPLRAKCTLAARGHGRTITTSLNEKMQKRLRLRIATSAGRERLRDRVGIEHRLAHIARRQGRRARYVGSRKNLFDLRRASAIQNLETVHRRAA